MGKLVNVYMTSFRLHVTGTSTVLIRDHSIPTLKVQFTFEQAMKTQRGSIITGILFL
jgi:hypothetical protein